MVKISVQRLLLIKFTLSTKSSKINKVLFVLVVDDKTKDRNINKIEVFSIIQCDSSMTLKLFEKLSLLWIDTVCHKCDFVQKLNLV